MGGGEATGAFDDAIGVGCGVEARGGVGVTKIVAVLITIGVGATVGAGIGVGIKTDVGGCRRHCESR